MLIVSCFSGLSISASASSATKTVWFDPGKASDGSPVWFAWTWDGVTDSWSKGTESGNYITFDNIGNKMIIVRMPKGSTKGDWDTCWNRTDTIDVSESNLVTFKAWGSNNYFTVTTGTYAGGEVPSSAAPDPEPTTRPAAAGGATADDYYLCGYINGANYGVEKDYETLGEYYFKNGTLTTSFSGVTWVGVKTGDNKNWYFYDGEEGCTETSAVLTKDAPEKMFIPAGVEVTLTLTVNKDDTVTLSYETGAEVPTEAPVTTSPVTEPTTRPAPAGGNTANDYYLCGYINGENYGVEEDYKTLGAYYFTNGTLKTSFTDVTWVGVKTGDNKNWYFYDGEEGCTETSAVLTKDAPEKMFIPAGVEVTLTLTVNKDDTVTLSYETGETIPTQPTEPYTGEGTKGDYYLCGYINGENYGVEEDYENLGDFHFVGGKLTTTFTAVTWVGVKTADNKKWYFYDGEVGCTETTAILTKDAPEKMFIPADVEVTLTLEENADGTLTLSYTIGGDEPTTNEPEETTAPVTEAPEIITPGFYIIGSKEVCGAEWSFEPWKYGVPMTQLGDSNIFTQTFTNVASSANAYDSTGAHRYEFKVVHVSEKGGITWHPGGMGNSTFVTVADNDSTLTFTFKLLAASPTTEGQYPEAVVCEVKSPFEPSTQAPTTQAPTTQAPTTQAPTTQAPTTQAPVTEAPTTQAPTTQAPVTEAPTTQAPTTQAPVTEAPTTQAPTTQAPVTEAPTTQAPTTQAPVTEAPTTQAPTTQAPVTEAPTTQAPVTEPAKKDISGWRVEGIKNKTYTGNLIKQKFDVVSSEGEYAKYTVEYRNNKKVGTATVIIKGKGDYTGTIKKTFKITKANNPMTVKAVAKTASIKTLKKKAVTVKGALAVKNNQGTVTYAKVAKGSSKLLTISKKGVITVKKGSAYKKNRKLKIKVNVTAKGNASYKAISKTITVTIKLK